MKKTKPSATKMRPHVNKQPTSRSLSMTKSHPSHEGQSIKAPKGGIQTKC